jgi:hypothetical protein
MAVGLLGVHSVDAHETVEEVSKSDQENVTAQHLTHVELNVPDLVLKLSHVTHNHAQ